MRFLAILIVLSLSFTTVCFQAAAGEKIGVVLMHGKRSTTKERSPVGLLRYKLEVEDFLVATPDMPWHQDRWLAKDYEQSMAEIDAVVADLRSRGATKIVVGGHSMGANAALGYGARRNGLAGILAIAAGHFNDDDGFQLQVDRDYLRAQEMVEAGKGDDAAAFSDVNQKKAYKSEIKARIYLSWYDPQGPASMKKNAAGLRPGTALMWIVGRKDRGARGKFYAFERASAHPKNAYVVVSGGHRDTPEEGADKIIAWLRALQCEKPWCGKPNPSSVNDPTTLKGFGRTDCTLEQLIKSECE